MGKDDVTHRHTHTHTEWNIIQLKKKESHYLQETGWLERVTVTDGKPDRERQIPITSLVQGT